MVDYYDKLLAAVPIALGVGAAIGVLAPVPFHQGLAVGCLLATMLLYEAIVRNPPVKPTPGNVTASVITGLSWVVVLVASFP